MPSPYSNSPIFPKLFFNVAGSSPGSFIASAYFHEVLLQNNFFFCDSDLLMGKWSRRNILPSVLVWLLPYGVI